METITDFGHQGIWNILNEIKTKKEKIQERCLFAALNCYLRYYSEVLQSSGSVFMET